MMYKYFLDVLTKKSTPKPMQEEYKKEAWWCHTPNLPKHTPALSTPTPGKNVKIISKYPGDKNSDIYCRAF